MFLVAWYQSTASATQSLNNTTSTITIFKTTASDVSLKVNITITTTDSPELSDNSGKTYYIVGGAKKENTSNKSVGTYSVSSVAFEEGGAAIWDADPTHTAAVPWTVYVVAPNVVSGAQAVLLDRTKVAATPAKDDGKQLNSIKAHALVLSIATNGAITVTSVDGANGSTGYFALRPANDSAEETFTPVDAQSDTTHMNYSSLLSCVATEPASEVGYNGVTA